MKVPEASLLPLLLLVPNSSPTRGPGAGQRLTVRGCMFHMPMELFIGFGWSSSSTTLAMTVLITGHCCYLKYLALKASQLRQAHRPRGTLTQTVKQPYSIYCLTGHVLKGVQWGNVKT